MSLTLTSRHVEILLRLALGQELTLGTIAKKVTGAIFVPGSGIAITMVRYDTIETLVGQGLLIYDRNNPSRVLLTERGRKATEY